MAARKKEQLLWDALKRASISAKYKLYRIENMIGSGMPDVLGKNKTFGTVFFLENKALHEWPARDSTQPLKTKFEQKQLPFAREWNSTKGNSFVLLRVGKAEWLLLKEDLRNEKSLDQMTRQELIDGAIELGIKNIIEYLENLKNEDNSDVASNRRGEQVEI